MKWQGVFLMNSYSYVEKIFFDSLVSVGYKCLPVVVEDQINCDDAVKKISCYDLVSNNIEDERFATGRPVYYNELKFRDGWTVSNGLIEEQKKGFVRYNGEHIAEIEYINSKKRFQVKSVKWLDKKGKAISRDFYDNFGNLCAKTIYDSEETEISKSWFSNKGCEVLSYTDSSKGYLYRQGGKEYAAKELSEVLGIYLDNVFCENNIDVITDTVSHIKHMKNVNKSRVCLIVHSKTVERELILLKQIDDANVCLIALDSVTAEILDSNGYKYIKLGIIPDFKKENKGNRDILICTQSDQIEKIDELVEELTEYTFNIVARTAVSDRLLKMQEKKNVNIYPGILQDTLDGLFAKCDYYLDINYFGQMEYSVLDAFYSNQVILAFEDTAHDRVFVANDNILEAGKWERLVDKIRTLDNTNAIEETLKHQKEKTYIRDEQTFKDIWMNV